MSGRANPFEKIEEIPVFTVKPKAEKPVHQEAVEEIAARNNFPSRQARRKESTPARPRRVYRTGRNRHLGIKATNETVERLYKLADERKVTLGALLELALDALERSAAA